MAVMLWGCGQQPNQTSNSSQAAAETGTAATADTVALGQPLPDFEGTTFDGETHRLSDLMDGEHYTVVVFHSPTCPCARTCAVAISEQLTPEAYPDVRFLGVLPDSNWDADWMREDLEKQQAEGIVTFPVIIDRDQSLMTKWGVERTPTVFLADKEGRLRYWGAPESTLEPIMEGYQFLLKDALDALRAGKEPKITQFDSVGCLISKRSTTGG
jgi:alkyl hydroperoxide reductase subunit AhpC